MTHVWKKGSLTEYHGEGRGHIERRLHGETVGGVWPACLLREGKTKDMAREVKPKHSMKMGQTKKDISKRERRTERHRKLYPLRRKGGTTENKAVRCHVLLTRLDVWEEDDNKCKADPAHRTKPKSHKQAKSKRELLHVSTKTVEEAAIDKPLTQEPRKRRLASLNAEAVNGLLLETADGPPGAKYAKKRGVGTTSTEHIKTCPKSETCHNPKQMKKAEAEEKDGLGLYAPTPKRLAGLNAAALLKLTSSTAGKKQWLKTDTRGVCASGKRPVQRQPKVQSCKRPVLKGGCDVYKSRTVELNLKYEGSPESHRLTKPGYQSCSMLGYPLKAVKEEQVEAELSPYFCCPPEGSVEYCHRLALFLGQQAYGEAEERPVTSVKHDPSLAHPTLTLSAHPCLCADPCYCSYYVHIAHTGPPAASLSSQPLPCAHSPFCPRGVSGSKLLPPSVPHASGIPHHAFCNSVGSPCYREACTVNRYTFSAMPPVTSRVCPFSMNCANCSHPIKTEGYTSSREEHSRTLLVPPASPLSRPRVPRANPSSSALPRLLNTLSDHTQAEVRLKVAKECPQNTKPPNGSLATGHSRLSQKQPTTGPASAKQKKVSHRRVTNGWQPVGVPTEKEVFIAGDDETVLRQCYEGVERDGDVIRVRDTVLLRSGPRKRSLPYVAKISALWEDPRSGELMMSLFWYYRPEHTQGGRDPSMHCENEIFASRHQDENSVACIEDRCYVLPLAQYCRFCALVKRRSEGICDSTPVVPIPADSGIPPHRLVPDDVDPELVYLCRHVYDFRYGRILKNLQ
ncbi:bromo adjacent homology domain-containing 1 protein-like [Xyrauchen texanus]|uniref:bromo adjacent homology domain-containing 1 protein-like n=1 Tax=Xyrauchen texanus TaxID=154827 RepID=UPI002241D980|nr:bromo adjacent homology domain-containing 1 protein-like [Xyrauchen texanus]